MQQELRATTDQVRKVIWARSIELFTVVAFSTTNRVDELMRTRIQRILRLPNRSGFMFNFQWGKTKGTERIASSVPYEEVRVAACPIKAVEQWIAVGMPARWGMTQGYLFPHTTAGADRIPVREYFLLTAPQIPALLKHHPAAANEKQDSSTQPLRPGGAVSRSCAMREMMWQQLCKERSGKSLETAWMYVRLAEVLSPETTVHTKATAITDEQYRDTDEIPSKEESKSWAAFGSSPMRE